MRKKILIYYRQAERYLYKNRWRLAFLSVAYMLLGTLTRLPYIGLLFTVPNTAILFWIVIMITLRLHPKNNFLFALILVFFAMFNTLRGRNASSEAIGIIIYALVVFGILQYFWLYIKDGNT